jgi:hypothetical protein
MGTYALGGTPSDIYYGIRRYPYSHDLTKDPLMFRYISEGEALPTNPPPAFGQDGTGNSEVHNVGEIWTSMLWDCYVGLLNDPSYTFDTAGQAMRDYLVASLSATPNSPTMTEARDAWLLVASQNADHPNDLMTFASAFARRGLGIGAVAPSSDSTDLTGVTESTQVGADIALGELSIDDDVTSCDHDHVIDAGETGTVTVTIQNTGVTQLTAATVKLSSTNPDISFPDGDTATVPATGVFENGTVKIKVALAATVTGVASFDLKVEMNDPNLVSVPAPGPRVQTLSFQANYDWQPASSATDDGNAPSTLWSTGTDPNLFSGWNWFRIPTPGAQFGLTWYNQDTPTTADEYLVSPPLHLGAGNFSFTFDHAFNFEEGTNANGDAVYYDGGVVELSTDGGATWIDLDGKFTAGGYNITLYDGKDPDLGPTTNPLQGRKGFGSTLPADFPNFMSSTVDLGTTYANQTVQVRFRVGTDQGSGAAGWIVDNVAFSGLTDTPFPTQVADRKLCGNGAPTASAGPDQMVEEGAMVTLDGSASADPEAATLHFHWTQIAGPTVALSDAAASQPTFTAPQVLADTELDFQLVVDDGSVFSGADTVAILVKDIPMPMPDMTTGPDMTTVPDMTEPPTGDMTTTGGDMGTGGSDMGTGGSDDMAQGPGPAPDMSKGGGHHGGCSTTGGGAPVSALPLLGLALLGLALRRRFI